MGTRDKRLEKVIEVVVTEEEDDEEENPNIWSIKRILKLSETDGLLPSPIDIHINNAIKLKIPCIEFHHYENFPKKMKITNSGETLILSSKWSGPRPFISGAFLPANYIFCQIHFHWGRTGYDGSEHTVEGKSYPLEMHALHFKENYKTLDEALRHDDGFLTLVYFFDIKSQHSTEIYNLLSKVNEIRLAGTSSAIEPFPITDFIFPFEIDYYFYYSSIKINNICDNKMLWIISRDIGYISVEQLKLFHLLLDPKLRPIYSNNRKIVQIFDRYLFHVNPKYEITNSTVSTIPLRFHNDRQCNFIIDD